MGSMEEFVHYANLIFVKRQLADPSITDEQRRTLAKLVALEQAKRFDEKEDGPGTLGRSPRYLGDDVPDCGGSPSSADPPLI